MNPLVSVTLTSYNQKDKLERAFNSLLNQTYKNLEIIIVDDCSTDGVSQNFIKTIAKQHPGKVKYHIQQNNVGIPKNKNTGFKLSTGEFITYLDGDDYYYPEKIENELKLFQSNQDLDVVYSNFNYENKSGEIFQKWKLDNEVVHEGKILKHIISRNFPRQTLFRCELMKSDVLKKINYLDESLFAFEDWDSRIRYSKYYNVGYCDRIGSCYTHDGKGISHRTNIIDLLFEMRKVFFKNLHLLKVEYSAELEKKIRKKFLIGLYSVILKNIDKKRRPYLYLKIILKKRLL